MTRLRKVVLGLAIASVCGVAVPLHADALPDDVRMSPTVKDPAALESYVKKQIERLVSSDPKVSATARDELCRQTEPAISGPQPSAAFQFAYVRAVAANLGPVVKSPNLSHRLNAAIVVSKLANATKQNELQDLTTQLLNDSSPAIALWGVKSAGALLPSVLNLGMNARNQKLTAGIISVVKKHGTNGALVQDAYRALDLSNAKLPAPALMVTTDATLEVMEHRIEEYKKGVPADPQSEREPLVALIKVEVFGNAAVATQMRIVQTTLNLLSVTAQRVAGMPTNDSIRERTVDTLNTSARSLSVQVDQMNLPPASKTNLKNALKPLMSVEANRLNAAQLTKDLQAAQAAFKAESALSALKDPPTVQPLATTATN